MIKNEERFSGKADIYKKFRSSYPKELIDYLYSNIGFCENSVIADIGSGTGIFSRLLLERGSRVYCVEPNDDMRRIAENDLGNATGFNSVKAPAENTGLQEGSIDFITAAQAFHWFEPEAFKKECRRILKTGGKVVLVWNVRDYESDIIKKDYEIRKKYCIDTKGLGVTDIPYGSRDFFSDFHYEEKIFRNDLNINRETYIGMNLSRSYSPCENKNPNEYNGLVKELNELFDKCNKDGVIHFPQFTKIYTGTVI
ncbi:MAG: class I SAM-dependent methyltransferase [Clostridiales bacterium]|jgi:SAM-dependent methyltransferase|nr:class I SAM-dependent methyltransferase [Clostridiales bacterium]